MEKAYIILVHQYPEQVYRLVQALDDKSSTFFIHIDKKTDIGQFYDVLQLEIVQTVKRVKLNWGGFSFVEAILNGLKCVKESGRNFDRVILLSGQDYPIKSNAFIDRFLTDSSFSVFMEHFPLPNYGKWKPNGGMYRVNKYYFGLMAYQRYAAKAINFLSRYFDALKRKLPGTLRPFAGSTWWIIDMYTLDHILDFVHRNPAYAAFHKNTFAPDEVFFQTILLNSTDERVAKSIASNNMRFIKWESIEAAHPTELTRKHMGEILSSDALFARKFTHHHSGEVLDLIDMYCLREYKRYN